MAEYILDRQKVQKADGTLINPATEEKQDAIVTAIEAIPGGGGTQYTEGDTDATITGTAILFEGAANTLIVPSSVNPLPVSATIDTTGLALAANQLPDGHNVTVDNASLAVTGTFWQATQPVSLATVPSHDVTNAGTFAVQVTSAPTTTVTATDLDIRNLTSTDVVTVTGGAGQTADVKVTLDGESVPVTGTFWQATQPVSFTGSTDVATQTTLSAINAKLVTGTDIGDVTINNAAGAAAVNIQDGGNTITVDGTVTVGSITAGDNNIGNVDVVTLPVLTAGTGALNTVGKVAPNDYELAGNTLHVKKYYTNAGAVTDGIIWSPAAGKRWYVTDLIINVSAAATVTLEDDLTAGDSAVMKFELAANSGIAHSFNTPLYSGEDAADLLITTTAGNVYVTVTGYEV